MIKAAQQDGFGESLGTLQALLNKKPERPAGESKDEVLHLPVDKVAEDPQQPRTEFDEEFLAWLAEDIKRKGVKSPVSVRPGKNGRYTLNHGACRLRASKIAGKDTIPAIIDTEYDAYDQVSENIKRKSLSARDLGRWIQGRMLAGDSREAVAKKLDVDSSYITRHLSILELSPQIMALVYDTGKCSEARALYELHLCCKQDADATMQYCQNSEDTGGFTVNKIKAFKKSLKKPSATNAPDQQSEPSDELTDKNKKVTSTPLTKKTTGKTHDRFKQPLVVVNHGEQAATLLIFKKPEVSGRVWVEYKTGRVAQVPSMEIKIIDIMEGEKAR